MIQNYKQQGANKLLIIETQIDALRRRNGGD